MEWIKENYVRLIIIALTVMAATTHTSSANVAIAASGACSWHGGVSCSDGPDWDGSVICMDGWADSTVSYREHCSSPSPALDCSYPICIRQRVSGCDSEEDYQQQQVLAVRLGYAGSEYGNKILQDCRDEINSQKQYDREYSECQVTRDKNINDCRELNYDIMCAGYGYDEWNGSECACSAGRYRNSQYGLCVDNPTCPANSFLNSNNQCQCNTGYAILNNQCVPGQQYCEAQHGVNWHYESSTKTCSYREPNQSVQTPANNSSKVDREDLQEEPSVDLEKGWLVKNRKYADVFYVTSELKLRWIRNEQSAERNFGKDWNRKIHEYDEITGYDFGNTIELNTKL